MDTISFAHTPHDLILIFCVFVLAGLVNNLLPLCEPGVSKRTVIQAALIVALIFVVVTALAIGSAWLYGLYLGAQQG